MVYDPSGTVPEIILIYEEHDGKKWKSNIQESKLNLSDLIIGKSSMVGGENVQCGMYCKINLFHTMLLGHQDNGKNPDQFRRS